MEAGLQGSSRITAEYDAFGQVIITEGGGKFSLRSRSSGDSVSKSANGPDDVRSLAGVVDRLGQTNGNGLSHTSAVQADLLDPPATPRSGASPHYRRRNDVVGEEATSTILSGGTASTSSSLLRRIADRNKRRKTSDDSDSDSTTRYSDFSRTQGKRAGGRRGKKRRKKKHQGRSIDKHINGSASRRYSAAGVYDVGGPDNDYWRELVAEQRRRSSLDSTTGRGQRRSTISSPRRRSAVDDNKLSVRPPRANGASPAASDATTNVSHYDGDLSLGRSERLESFTSNVDRRCSSSVVLPALIFVVVGCLLIMIGVTRIFICFWHEFGSSVWTGALVSQLIARYCTIYEIFYCHTCIRKTASRHGGCQSSTYRTSNNNVL